MDLLIVALTCSMAVSAQDCDRNTALDVAIGGTARLPSDCLKVGQVAMANHEMAGGTYLKLTCARRHQIARLRD